MISYRYPPPPPTSWAGIAALVLFLFALAFCVGHATGCQPSTPAVAAESAYTTELLRCVDTASTLAESRACRSQVSARWGVTEASKDGGR